MKIKMTFSGIAKASVMFLLLAAPGLVSAHDLLTDKNGMVMYTLDNDVAGSGASACSWYCIRVWPPVPVRHELGELQPGYGAITREGGERQLTYHGKPLYYYVGDRHPGDANGDGIYRMWHVVTLPHLHPQQRASNSGASLVASKCGCR